LQSGFLSGIKEINNKLDYHSSGPPFQGRIVVKFVVAKGSLGTRGEKYLLLTADRCKLNAIFRISS
jgi:hypothetical protein